MSSESAECFEENFKREDTVIGPGTLGWPEGLSKVMAFGQ